MVEVVTSKEFDEFKKSIEDRLDNMDKNRRKGMNDLVKALGDLTKQVDEISAKVEDVEEKSKSVVTRIKEAFEPVVPE